MARGGRNRESEEECVFVFVCLHISVVWQESIRNWYPSNCVLVTDSGTLGSGVAGSGE